MKRIPIMLLAILASIGTSLAQGPQSWYSLATSRTGDTVRLNDLEPHTWSYYTAASPIHSLNPADVTITYYGNGTATMTSSSNDDNDPTSFTENVTTVQVGIDAAEHTFVYHKTLERENADGSSHCPYTTIANPFSVRPTGTGSGNAKYRGFYKWRIKSVSGGAIKSADGATTYTAYSGSGATAATNMLDADQSYHFVPNAPYGMTVELEALWAQAYVYTGSGTSPFVAAVGRERNFYVVDDASTTELPTGVGPCTYSSFYPNGTTNGTTTATLNDRATRRASFTADNDCKIEYIKLRNYDDDVINANMHNFTLGRGIEPYDTRCCYQFRTIPNSGNTSTHQDFKVRVESGTYAGGGTGEGMYSRDNFYLLGTGYRNNGTFHLDIILGCDYDRAEGDDTKLTVATSNQILFGSSTLGEANKSHRVLDCTIKSGKYQEDFWDGTHGDNDADYDESFYCGSTQNNSYPGIRYVTVEGGQLASINGGRGTTTSSHVNSSDIVFSLRLRGGLVYNSLYGAASSTVSYGGRRFVITGGEVRGWLAAGCNGTANGGGHTEGAAYIYIGGDSKIGNASHPRTINSTVGGNVFGAGRGNSGHIASIVDSYIVVADDAEVLHDVYGGGNYGHNTHQANIYIVGGTVKGKVFGGANQKQGAQVDIHMTGGTVIGGVYGGFNSSGIVTGPVNVNIVGGTVGEDGQDAEHGHVFGSGYVWRGLLGDGRRAGNHRSC